MVLLGRGCIRNVLTSVTSHPDVCLLSMTREPFESTQSRAIFADHHRCRVGFDALIRTCLEKFTNPQATRIARGLARRQRVICSDHLVTIDRKSAVSGKSVSVRVDLGWRRIIKKKTTT